MKDWYQSLRLIDIVCIRATSSRVLWIGEKMFMYYIWEAIMALEKNSGS